MNITIFIALRNMMRNKTQRRNAQDAAYDEFCEWQKTATYNIKDFPSFIPYNAKRFPAAINMMDIVRAQQAGHDINTYFM